MKVLFLNNYYYERGGAEKSLFYMARLLESNGHPVYFMSTKFKDNDDYLYDKYFVSDIDFKAKSILEKIRAMARIYYNFEANQKTQLMLNEIDNVDIVHMNNIMYRIGPSLIRLFKRKNIPVVFHLRDYNLMCGAIYLISNGQICEECKGYRFSRVLKKRCKEGLAGGIAIYTSMVFYHKIMKYFDDVNTFISPSSFLKEKYLDLGFNKKIEVLPNFVNINDFEPTYESLDNSFVYFGRISQEKGILTLLNVCKNLPNLKFKIIGTGPLEETCRKFIYDNNLTNVQFLGYLRGEELYREIKKSKASIVPSEWYENNSRAILESMALGKPVIASNIGGNPELVKAEETGYLFEPFNGDDLTEKILFLEKENRSKELGERAREVIEREYTSEIYYEKLTSIYQKLINK